jgi:hypothetical protein
MLELHETNTRLRREISTLRSAVTGREEPGSLGDADPRPPHY